MSEPLLLMPHLTPYIATGSSTADGMTLSALIDRDNYTKAVTTSGASDSNAVAAYMYVDATVPSFTADRIILLRHNLKFGAGYGLIPYLREDGVAQTLANQVRLELTDSFGDRHTVLKFDTVGADEFICGLQHTAVADQQKSAAEVILTRPLVDLGQDMQSYDQRWREVVSELILGDGSLHRVSVLKGNGRRMQFEASCQFRFLTEAVVEALRAVKESGDSFLFQPESTTRPQDIYLVHWTGSWNVQYASSYKGAGWTVNMQLREV